MKFLEGVSMCRFSALGRFFLFSGFLLNLMIGSQRSLCQQLQGLNYSSLKSMFVSLFCLHTLCLALTLTMVSLGGLVTLHQTFSGWCFLQNVIRISSPGRRRPPLRPIHSQRSLDWRSGSRQQIPFTAISHRSRSELHMTFPSALED